MSQFSNQDKFLTGFFDCRPRAVGVYCIYDGYNNVYYIRRSLDLNKRF